jgi:hypothetical protein
MSTRFCLAFLLTFLAPSGHAQQNQGTNPLAQQQQSSNIPAEEAHFTAEQMKDYYLVYKNADVRYLRRVFDAYLRGARVTEEESESLGKWDKAYYRSKFVVLSRDNNTFGGTFITIMFQDRPDKVFVAWVYPEGSRRRLTLKGLDLGKFTEEDIRRMRIRYRRFLEDKVHAM